MSQSTLEETTPLLSDTNVEDNISNRPRQPPSSNPSSREKQTTRNSNPDNLRIFLTAFIVLHNTAIVLRWHQRLGNSIAMFPPESLILIALNAINQTFFMTLCFFLSDLFWQFQLIKKSRRLTELVRTPMLRIANNPKLNKHICIPVAWTVTILSNFAIRSAYPVARIWEPLSLQLAYLPLYSPISVDTLQRWRMTFSSFSPSHIILAERGGNRFTDPFLVLSAWE
jgi:hypothetical protein